MFHPVRMFRNDDGLEMFKKYFVLEFTHSRPFSWTSTKFSFLGPNTLLSDVTAHCLEHLKMFDKLSIEEPNE